MSQRTDPALPRELPASLLSDEFLLSMIAENLNQARHAENERMMFVTLFAALVGGMLAVASEVKNDFFSTIIILLLFVLNMVCSNLTRRWNTIFKTHWSLACQIGCYLSDRCLTKDYSPSLSQYQGSDFWKRYGSRVNRFFCFDNHVMHPEQKHYIHTAALFALFNRCIYALLTLSLLYIHWERLARLFSCLFSPL